MKIIATSIGVKSLKPGDLFSTFGQLYWDNLSMQSLGEKVYIRTEAPIPPKQADGRAYRITIEP